MDLCQRQTILRGGGDGPHWIRASCASGEEPEGTLSGELALRKIQLIYLFPTRVLSAVRAARQTNISRTFFFLNSICKELAKTRHFVRIEFLEQFYREGNSFCFLFSEPALQKPSSAITLVDWLFLVPRDRNPLVPAAWLSFPLQENADELFSSNFP